MRTGVRKKSFLLEERCFTVLGILGIACLGALFAACSGESSTDADAGADADGDADADADTDTDTDGDTDADADTDTDGDTDGDTDADTDGDTDGDTDADGDGDADGDTDADTDGDTDADGDTGLSGAQKALYEQGSNEVETVAFKAESGGLPRPVRVTSPTEPGTYPVVFLFHGFLCVTAWYDVIATHLASHGFIVVAVQTINRGSGLPIGKPKITAETKTAHETVEWLMANLGTMISVTPDLENYGFAGHSRGGKVAWNLLLNFSGMNPSAIAGIDPVDGTGIPAGTDIMILKEPATYDIPSLAIGTGLGSVVKSMIACAPLKDGHEHFYEMVPAPAWHIIAEDFGHMDMLDPGINCGATCSSCAATKTGDRVAFRSQIGGALTAFFGAALRGDADYYDLLENESDAPVLVSSEHK